MNLLFARIGRSEAVNRWHAEHPAVLGVLALLFGLLILGSGAFTLATGKKDGRKKQILDDGDEGMRACLSVIGGIGCILFGIARLIYAAL